MLCVANISHVMRGPYQSCYAWPVSVMLCVASINHVMRGPYQASCAWPPSLTHPSQPRSVCSALTPILSCTPPHLPPPPPSSPCTHHADPGTSAATPSPFSLSLHSPCRPWYLCCPPLTLPSALTTQAPAPLLLPPAAPSIAPGPLGRKRWKCNGCPPGATTHTQCTSHTQCR